MRQIRSMANTLPPASNRRWLRYWGTRSYISHAGRPLGPGEVLLAAIVSEPAALREGRSMLERS
jgi:hypothetical protein